MGLWGYAFTEVFSLLRLNLEAILAGKRNIGSWNL